MSKELLNNTRKDKGFSMKSMPIADLVNSFKKALILKQAEMQECGIAIEDVKLTLKAVAKADAGAGISLQIPVLGKIEFGSEISEKSIQTTTLTLKPTTDGKVGRGIKLTDMDKTVAQSISSIIDGVKAASSRDSIPLEMEEASFTFNFILSGDLEIAMIIENGFESELSNTLKINFKMAEN